MSRTPELLLTATQDALEAVRSTSPLVQCITNNVVVGFTANTLLAVGAAPAMVDIPEEAGMFAGVASGVLINLGTCREEQRAAALEAAPAANAAGTPWVLDPVAIGALPVRTSLAHRLRDLGPSLVRGNASEILALAELGTGGRGVDSTSSVDDALTAGDSGCADSGCCGDKRLHGGGRSRGGAFGAAGQLCGGPLGCAERSFGGRHCSTGGDRVSGASASATTGEGARAGGVVSGFRESFDLSTYLVTDSAQARAATTLLISSTKRWPGE
mgnify:CR=1 FL=1